MTSDRVTCRQQIAELEKNTQDPLAAIELTYQRFKRGNTIAKRYKDATAAEKREMLAEVLSNSTLENRNIVSFQYKTPFAAMAKVPANPSISQLLPD